MQLKNGNLVFSCKFQILGNNVSRFLGNDRLKLFVFHLNLKKSPSYNQYEGQLLITNQLFS